eukprot:CAMPEP_0177522394 /NCGR_PEP_ID=MMETSP0369-20130122/48769_1 /TAXON_ID=447022 ORGANISM="Scrippsiella hangoei-like, Strain SHHI-4" /NCGR_SAMPLE_ID=MMETSP0369 /ASSEMBLY_ACC=CAM_ASM_000364 /LENGTH=136 /DNA_ID=CAMNT_0019002033 /DNA_START=511 /DNA_END=922 /DNA_ORIENTATION=+
MPPNVGERPALVPLMSSSLVSIALLSCSRAQHLRFLNNGRHMTTRREEPIGDGADGRRAGGQWLLQAFCADNAVNVDNGDDDPVRKGRLASFGGGATVRTGSTCVLATVANLGGGASVLATVCDQSVGTCSFETTG